MPELNTFQKYFVEEFYDDFLEGHLTRRQFIRRVAFITGSMAAAIATMNLLGCSPSVIPSPTEVMPTATAVAAALAPVPGAQSPLSVPEGDPAVTASDVTFSSGGDQITAYLARPLADGVYPAILVCHENRGLNPHIRDVARRFAKAGYAALALDLLSREGGTASQVEDQVPALLSGAPAERHVEDFRSGLVYLQSQSYVDGERMGMTGYCFGGGITWRAAASIPELKAAVPFYGPGPELDDVPNIGAAVFGVYAEQDSRINAGKDALEEALMDAGTTYQMKIYPGVNHAFHNDTGERYVEGPATEAWNDTLAWFEMHL
jgi:carboxymethylenebutenolidase